MTFNQEEYIRLFSEIVIKPIESDVELDRYVKLVEPYFFKAMKKELTPEEVAIYNLLTILIVEYEREHHPDLELTPLEFLKGCMESHNLKEEDLVPVFGNGYLTKLVLNGTREIDIPIAKALGHFFSVDYKSFL